MREKIYDSLGSGPSWKYLQCSSLASTVLDKHRTSWSHQAHTDSRWGGSRWFPGGFWQVVSQPTGHFLNFLPPFASLHSLSVICPAGVWELWQQQRLGLLDVNCCIPSVELCLEHSRYSINNCRINKWMNITTHPPIYQISLKFLWYTVPGDVEKGNTYNIWSLPLRGL